MDFRDMHNNILPVVSLSDQNCKVSTIGTGIDLAGFGSAEVLFSVGVAGDTWAAGVKVKLEVYECDTVGGFYTKIDDDDLLGAVAEWTTKTAHENKFYSVGYIGKKQFIAAYIKLTGTHTVGSNFAACVIKGKPTHAPAQ